ncbi:kinase-like protein [Aureobasidium pullulans]|uniref:non-specific serine/threonine protein kinase n=1 Tax=Aureobasidium pullulans TaxID=5580 RepID=A0A4S9LFW3_AURPU|nr:kinase-like protein [Aureobasidium pullulans]THY28351.1 kinase-like protein [Aureobasidium pullulans]
MAETEAEKYEVLTKIGIELCLSSALMQLADTLQVKILCRKEICYTRMSQKEREQLSAELDILRGLRHPNIVAYYEKEHLKASHDLHLYMEYCGNGDLGMMIKDLKARNEYADEEFVWTIFAQLVSALYRCHYGEDPPDVNSNALGLTKNALPLKSKQAHKMILHRDLKPENVFLGEGNAVKLGDFGLSKIILSHDFASTYVGTPFYMSPEICAAERYSLYSDIWSLGCIVYELCSREPPFNARTHLELIQKIKLGKVAPLPRAYSKELSDVISACLQVNPNSRPDTASLLNLPRVKLVRKTQEGVMVLQQHITAKENAIAALKSAQDKIARLEAEQQAMHDQLDKQLRLEWETKAHLEINRQVDVVGDRLREHYKLMFEQQVEEEVERRLASLPSSRTSSMNSTSDTVEPPKRSSTPTQSLEDSSSLVTIGEADEDGPSLNALSLEDSPLMQRHKPLKSSRSSNRTPFTRAKTFAGTNEVAPSPMDIQMADPSPMSIASLSLSPRRNAPLEGSKLRQPAFKGPNMFDRATRESNLALFPEDGDDDDAFGSDGGSPIRSRPNSRENDPFKVLAQPSRPAVSRQKTMPTQLQSRLKSVPNLAPSTRRAAASPSRSPMNKGLPISPSRRAPAIPSQPSKTALATKKGAKSEDMIKTVHRNNLQQGIQGRTLVELAQARGIPSPSSSIEVPKVSSKATLDREPLWDPERDEMPSPFLIKTRRVGIMPR